MVIYEVGVGPVSTCRSKPYWNEHECVLFEPVVSFYKEILNEIPIGSNVKLYNIVIYDYNGKCDFVESSQMSHIKGINSPYTQFKASDGVDKYYTCAKITDFDKGDIDLLFLDMEGAEWFVLKYLISRPGKIIVETELASRYKNPFLNEIQKWMQVNRYSKTDTIGADTVWEKSHKVFI